MNEAVRNCNESDVSQLFYCSESKRISQLRLLALTRGFSQPSIHRTVIFILESREPVTLFEPAITTAIAYHANSLMIKKTMTPDVQT